MDGNTARYRANNFHSSLSIMVDQMKEKMIRICCTHRGREMNDMSV
jgi:hypothetical protein